MTDNTNFTATLRLEQRGLNGTINMSTDFSPETKDYMPEAYAAMVGLAAAWFQAAPQLETDPADDESEDVYVSTLTLQQAGPGSDIYSHLDLSPTIPFDSEEFPSSYEAACYLAAQWLYMAGIVDEDFNIIDESAVGSTVTMSAGDSTVH